MTQVAHKNCQRILILGGESPVVRALLQILESSGITVYQVTLENEKPNTVLASIAAEFRDSGPSLVVASSVAGWRATRALNAWPLVAGVFESGTLKIRQGSKVMPMPHLLLESLFDHFTTDRSKSADWLRALLDAIHDTQTQPGIEVHDLRTAALHYFMAEARHGLPLKPSADSHGRNDVHAAIRIIQGAALDGWISAIEGQAGCAAVWDHAGKQGLVNGPLNPTMSHLFQLLPTIAREDIPQFGALLVADDQGFWGRPLTPIWNKMGLELLHESKPDSVLARLNEKANDANPVRAVLLDVQLDSDAFGGVKLLRTFQRDFPELPVIVLSVDDQFSETVLLKRMGAFAYLNKHSLAEQGPGRDALSAFRQVRDAILVTTFASLSEDLRRLWRIVMRAYENCLISEKMNLREAAIADLDHHVECALDVFRHECRRMFHGFWQDSSYSAALAFRQIIRAFGLVNDKWGSFWKEWRFYPDHGNRPWLNGADVEFPFLIYHQITTSIRNEASHAMVTDAKFEWLDAWITILTLFLKIDGTCRGYLAPNYVGTYSAAAKKQMEQLIRSLWSLLKVNGCIEASMSAELDNDQLRFRLIEVSKTLDQELKKHQPCPKGFAEGDDRRLSIQPYAIGHVDGYPLMHALGERFEKAGDFSPEQLQAHLLVITMISQRVASGSVRHHAGL